MQPIVTIHPHIVSGEPCFQGTRVPVKILFDYFKASMTTEDFLLDFPSVSKMQIADLLEELNGYAQATATRISA